MLRRTLLASLAAARVAPVWAAPKFKSDPFQMGIASGDPLPDGVVLWTRLMAPELGKESHEVEWVVAEDEQLKKIVKRGKATAAEAFAHTVHADVRGLQPGRWYFYQFRVSGVESPVGRTRTAPAAASQEALHFAFASCQHFETGFYTAYEHMVKEDLHLIVHLGDYIYENGPGTGPDRVRKHTGGEIFTITDYRNRYALYRSDKQLQKAHQMLPWIVTWDDHETDNDYANDHQENGAPREQFLERRANAYQAYWENMPIRSRSVGSRLDLYRRFDFGRTARIHVLDTRQYRSVQPCGAGRKPMCPDALSDKQTILGKEQFDWLTGGMKSAPQAWNVLAQQVPFVALDTKPGEGEEFSMDKWNGYDFERRRLLRFFGEAKPSHPIVLTGDVHSHWAADIKADFAQPNSATLGSEFIGTSITSAGDGLDLPMAEEAFKRDNPHLKFFAAKRGYVSCRVTGKEWRTDYQVVPFVTKPGAPLETRAKFVVENAKPGMQRA
ncbi:MAG: alkaline phosphatase PhoD [Bryobacter sp.]